MWDGNKRHPCDDNCSTCSPEQYRRCQEEVTKIKGLLLEEVQMQEDLIEKMRGEMKNVVHVQTFDPGIAYGKGTTPFVLSYDWLHNLN